MKLDYLAVKQLFETQSQYIVPLYQRTYSWGEKQWQELWEDIQYLHENQNQYHFLGSVVLMEIDTPHGTISKYVLIDGQQRLLTIQILLKALSKKLTNPNVLDIFIKNSYPKTPSETLKIYPTKRDQEAFEQILLEKHAQYHSQQEQVYLAHLMLRAYSFFENKISLMNDTNVIEKIKDTILSQLKIVYIRLDQADNAYEIFESLNAKGAPLTQSDLIRNFLFMQFSDDEKLQNSIYQNQWLPIEQRLSTDDSDQITKFIRHYLTMYQIASNEKNVYQVFSSHYKKHLKNKEQFVSLLEDINHFSLIYQKIFNPQHYEHDFEIKYALIKIDKIEVTTSYPLLMFLYDLYFKKNIDKSLFVSILDLTILYLLRRFVCSYPSNALNKIFSSVVNELKNEIKDKKALTKEMFKGILYRKNFPTDDEVRTHFPEHKLYQKNKVTTKILLEILEQTFFHKENVIFDALSIEHIMPQKLSDNWIYELDQDQQYDENQIANYLHTIGNLTLTAYNANMSNQNFSHKKDNFYQNSHLELNKHLAHHYYKWNVDCIKKRALFLLDKFLSCFQEQSNVKQPNIKQPIVKITQKNDPPPTQIPKILKINENQYIIENESWRKVFIQIFLLIKKELNVQENSEDWEIFKSQFNRFIKTEKDDRLEEYTRAIELGQNEYLYTNMSKDDIYRSIHKIFLFLANQYDLHAELIN